MSRDLLMDALLIEVYAATDYDAERFKPMDPRRIKRAANLMDRTGWTDSETVNCIAGAAISSLRHRAKKQQNLNPAKEPKS